MLPDSLTVGWNFGPVAEMDRVAVLQLAGQYAGSDMLTYWLTVGWNSGPVAQMDRAAVS
jgi:hypothetical protein